MHFRSWLFAVIAGALFLIAPSARADGCYVTFSNGSTTSVRSVGAVFNSVPDPAETATDSVGMERQPVTTLTSSGGPGSVHIEIDDWSAVESILSVWTPRAFNGQMVDLTTKVEFLDGSNTVVLTSEFSPTLFKSFALAYNATGNTTTLSIDLSYLTEKRTGSPPSTKPGTPAVKLSVPKVVPQVARIGGVIRPPALHIDAGWANITGVPGEGTGQHQSDFKLASYAVAFKWAIVFSKLGGVPRIALGAMTTTSQATKQLGAASAALGNAAASPTPRASTFQFVQTGSPDTALYTVKIDHLRISADSLSSSGGSQTENVSFVFTTSTTTNVSDTKTSARLTE